MKTTYIYRVDLGHHGECEYQTFCYARNSKVAAEYYKNKFHSEKYDTVKIVPFGTADMHKHPGPFEELPQDEINYLVSNHIGFEDSYSCKPNVPTNGTFIPVGEENQL